MVKLTRYASVSAASTAAVVMCRYCYRVFKYQYQSSFRVSNYMSRLQHLNLDVVSLNLGL